MNLKRLKSLFLDVDFLAALISVSGFLVFLIEKAEAPNPNAALTFFDSNPFKVKEDIINQYQNITFIMLEVIAGLVFLSKFAGLHAKMKKGLQDYIILFFVALLLALVLNLASKSLAQNSYFPKLQKAQQKAILASVAQISADGTVNAQHFPGKLIPQEVKRSRIQRARENLLLSCDLFEMDCPSSIPNGELINKFKEMYHSP